MGPRAVRWLSGRASRQNLGRARARFSWGNFPNPYFDEYVLVIEGRCFVIVEDRCVELVAGQELFIPNGTRQSMAVVACTRTMHVFGAPRAERETR